MASKSSKAATIRMQPAQADAWMAASRGGSPVAPAVSQAVNRSCGSFTP
jgi:hypothetical protein